MPSLDHVRWVGGGSGAGKTTVTRVLAERFGVRIYSTDAAIGVHAAQLPATVAPLLEAFRGMTMDQRWVDPDPVTMHRSFPWFQGEGFDLVLDDLRRLPADRLVIAEGFRLLPALVRPYLSDRRHGVWLLPTPSLRKAAFAQRGRAEAFWMRTTDPVRALANLLERDRLFTEELSSQTELTDVDAIHVDGTRSVDRMAEDLAQRFGLMPRPHRGRIGDRGGDPAFCDPIGREGSES